MFFYISISVGFSTLAAAKFNWPLAQLLPMVGPTIKKTVFYVRRPKFIRPLAQLWLMVGPTMEKLVFQLWRPKFTRSLAQLWLMVWVDSQVFAVATVALTVGPTLRETFNQSRAIFGCRNFGCHSGPDVPSVAVDQNSHLGTLNRAKWNIFCTGNCHLYLFFNLPNKFEANANCRLNHCPKIYQPKKF